MMYLTVTPDKNEVMNITVTFEKKVAKPFSVKTVNETLHHHELEFSLTSSLEKIKPAVKIRPGARPLTKPVTTHEDVLPLEYMLEVVINPLTGKGGKSPRMRLTSDYQRTRLLLKKRSNHKISCDTKDWIKGTEAYYIQCIHTLGKGFLCVKDRKVFRKQQQEQQKARQREARETERQEAREPRRTRGDQQEEDTQGTGREEGGDTRRPGEQDTEGQATSGTRQQEGGEETREAEEPERRGAEGQGEARGLEGYEGQTEGQGGQEGRDREGEGGQEGRGREGEEGEERIGTGRREGEDARGAGVGAAQARRGAGGRDARRTGRQDRQNTRSMGGRDRQGERVNAEEKECKIEEQYKVCVKGINYARTVKHQNFMLFRLQPAQL